MKSPFANSSLRNRLTVGVLVLSAIGFIGAGVGAQALLKNYLINQVDDQLLSVVNGTADRLDQAGIARDDDDDDDRGPQAARATTPLNRVPTSISVTVLDPFGNLIGGIGGDLNSNQVTEYVKGLLPGQVAAFGSKPFTIEAPGADFRVATTVLPSSLGSVIVAQSLSDFDKTTRQIGIVFLIIGGLVLLFIAFASRQVIELSMKPLEKIEATAEKIAAGDLSARLENFEPDTEVGRLSTSLNQMLSRIEESFAARTESEGKLRRFVADASHELRTPLTSIRGFAELHRQGAVPEGEKTKELISRIEKESMRMGSLVEDLLMLARIDQSREIVMADVDLSTLIKEAVTSAQVAGPEHPITSDIAHDVHTQGDSDKIYQVVTNLLANARAHTPAGTAIHVATYSADDGTYVTVEDKGPGLTAEDQQHVFERFYRVDTSRQRSRSDGSGLGLSIVDEVMKAHGGSVSVSSEPGNGATFTLHFKSLVSPKTP
jgi:two-component system OmpR family sensor kinase